MNTEMDREAKRTQNPKRKLIQRWIGKQLTLNPERRLINTETDREGRLTKNLERKLI